MINSFDVPEGFSVDPRSTLEEIRVKCSIKNKKNFFVPASELPKAIRIEAGEEIFISFVLRHKDVEWHESKEVVINYRTLDFIDIGLPSARFDDHISDPRNINILFSAPFGEGKSTFLNYYFKEREKRFRHFKLSPVNYSVASNEDIFKYIKCELLLQLMKMNVQFEQTESPEHTESKGNFFLKNIDRFIAPVVLLAPKVGGSVYKMYEEFKKLATEYQDLHELSKIEELSESEQFIQNLHETEGSIYEDNFYTQVIRKLLQKFKNVDPSIENVLIIDDLDRLDPEHIFRILNVFSVHFDSFESTDYTVKNKFDFDRIILVGDIENIRHIYEHKYGKKVDFSGYINKFYSTKPFEFNNKPEVRYLLQDIDRKGTHRIHRDSMDEYFYFFAEALFKANLISLRDIIKLREIGLTTAEQELKLQNSSEHKWVRSSQLTPAINLLSKVVSFPILQKKISQLGEQHFSPSLDVNRTCYLLIVGLTDSAERNINYIYKNESVNVSIDLSIGYEPYDSLKIEGVSVKNLNQSTNPEYVHNFSHSDLIELLKRNIEKLSRILVIE